MPPIEAMACGAPVLTSNRGSLTEVVGDAAVLVDPEDIGAMKWQMQRLASNPNIRQQVRSLGFAQAKKFSWERTAQRTLEVYSRALNKVKLHEPAFAPSPFLLSQR